VLFAIFDIHDDDLIVVVGFQIDINLRKIVLLPAIPFDGETVQRSEQARKALLSIKYERNLFAIFR